MLPRDFAITIIDARGREKDKLVNPHSGIRRYTIVLRVMTRKKRAIGNLRAAENCKLEKPLCSSPPGFFLLAHFIFV